MSAGDGLRDLELAGDVVKLVPVHPRFAQRAYELLRHQDEILRWLVWDGPGSVVELEQSFGTWVRPGENGDNFLFAIIDRETGAFAGSIGPRFAGHPGTADIGYWLARDLWGGGRMTEAVRLVDHLTFHHLGARVMTATVFVGNAGSRRVLEKNGYRLTHVAREAVNKGGVLIDEWCFTLTRHDHDEVTAGWKPTIERVERDPATPA